MIVSVLGLAARSLGILLVAFLIAPMLRKASAGSRRLLWVLSLASLVALPLASFVTPGVPVPAERIRGLIPTVQQPWVAHTLSGIREDISRSRTAIEPDPSPEQTATEIAYSTPSVTDTLFFAWMVLGLFVLVRLIFGLISVAFLVRRTSPWTGESAGLRIRLSDRITVPATVGMFRPVVILPRQASGWPVEKLRMVLAHEKSHIAHGDWFWNLVAQIACALYALNPLVWIAARRFRTECELVADDRVLQAGFAPGQYAEQLVEIARDARRIPCAVAMACVPRVEGRIRAIVDRRRRRGSVRWLTVCITALIAAGLCMSLAAFQFGRQPQGKRGYMAVAIDYSKSPAGWKGPLLVKVLDENGHPAAGARLCFLMATNWEVGYAALKTEPLTNNVGEFNWKPATYFSNTEEAKRLIKEGDTYAFNEGFFRAATLEDVFAYLPGHAIGVPDRLPKEGDKTVVIHLTRSNSARVPVLLPTGRPAVGVMLSAKYYWNTKYEVNIPRWWSDAPFRPITDAKGIAEFRDIPRGWGVGYEIADERYMPNRFATDRGVSGVTEYPPVKLIPGAVLEGDVRCDGRPMSGIQVQASFVAKPNYRGAKTDSNGHFRITRVAGGLCNLDIYPNNSKPGAFPAGRTTKQINSIQVPTGGTLSGLNFDLVRGGVIEGVATLNGKVETGCQVDVVSPTWGTFSTNGAESSPDYYADADPLTGHYSVRVAPGRYKVNLNFGPNEGKWVDVADGATVRLNFELRPLRVGQRKA
jgi:beta-lactamase regulating signal transducer with metallopeptidase domain